jgi:protease-4
MLTLRIEREFMEVEKESFFGKRKISLVEIMEGIRQASTDRTISGLILEINYCGLGFAQIQELREEIRNFRSSGKSVHAVITAPGNREYYLASSADRIYYSPNALFTITGLSANVYFFKSLMAKVGIRFESISHGKYKSAFESFTREGISDEARENLTAIVKDLNEQFLTDISQERKLSPEALDAVLKGGGITPEEARALNFIDEISYYDAALEAIDKKLVTVKFGRYIDERKRDLSWGRKPAIAVIHVGGNIVRGGSSNSALGASTGDRTYEEMLTRSFSDESVAALVIRVSSGGGSAIASDLMQRRLIQLQNKFRKPVVFSFGDIAASGGYYIACTENTIIADRGSITGSIGVISGKLTLRELYEKLGVSKETIKMSDLADIYSESKDLTPEERAVIQKGVDYIYDQFTGKVMEYRGIPAERIPAVAEGRVFTGSQALPKGLVDRMGGLVTAIELAAEKGAISREYELQILPDQDSILSGMLESDDLKAVKEMIRPLIRNYDMTRFGNERALYIMPYRLEIE